MTGAAIASAGMSVYNGMQSSKNAKKASGDSQMAEWRSQYYSAVAMENIEGNQAEVDTFKAFLDDMSVQGTEYAQGILNDWEQTFGGIEDNLSEYYNNLDPTKFATGEKAKFKQNMDKQMEQYNETMAASGLQSAGMKAQTAKEAAFKTAEANSQIDLSADEYVKNQKAGFLDYGEPQRKEAQRAMGVAQDNETALGRDSFNAQFQQNNAITDMYRNQAGIETTNARDYGESAAGYSQSAGNYFGSAMSSGITAYEGLTDKPYDWMGDY